MVHSKLFRLGRIIQLLYLAFSSNYETILSENDIILLFMALYWIQVPLACTCTGYLVYLAKLRPLLSNRQINNSLTRFNVRVIKLAVQLADSGEQLIKRCRSKLLCFDYKLS